MRRALLSRWRSARERHVKLARTDVNEFCAFVGRDSETGRKIVQAPIHVAFQRAADEHKRAIFMSFPDSGKSTQLGVLRLLFLLGKNPNLRIAIVSKTAESATKNSRAMKSYVERSRELADVFPALVPGEVWKDDFFTVKRSAFSRDPSVQALGYDGSPTGSRIDVLVLEDVLDAENTATPQGRKHVLGRIRKAFLDRLSADAAVIFLTNAWHPEDAAHVFEKEGWHVEKHPVVDEDGAPTWEEHWPLDRVESAREDLGPLEFARAHLCKARDEGESPFDEDAIEAAKARAVALGVSLVYSVRRDDLPPGACIFTGVDLAVTKDAKRSHLTVLTTILLWPDDLSRQILWVESGRWSSREIRGRVLDTDRRYDSPIFIVENNAAQRWIIDIIENQADLDEDERRLPTLIPFTTGKNKAHPEFGVEGLAVEIERSWIVPVTGPAKAVKDVEELLGEMLYYTRGAHTGDRLMSAWFAREGARRGARAGRRERDRSTEKELAPMSFAPDVAEAGVRSIG